MTRFYLVNWLLRLLADSTTSAEAHAFMTEIGISLDSHLSDITDEQLHQIHARFTAKV